MTQRQDRSTTKDPAPAPAKAGAGPFFRAVFTLGAVGALLVVGTGARSLVGHDYRDAPPVGYSGGFGEQSCTSCHYQDSVNLPPGRVSFSGVPERWTQGQSYAITVTLSRPGMLVAGFELTARFDAGGAQAGTLSFKPEDDARMKVTTQNGVQYAHHLRPGTSLASRDTARWIVLWTAPTEGGDVSFNVAANAASDDDSPLGDFIYTAAVKATSGR